MSDFKLTGVADTLVTKVCPSIWALTSFRSGPMKFNKAKSRILHIHRGNPQDQCRLSDEFIESSSTDKDLRVLVDEKFDMTQRFVLVAQKTNHILGYIKRRMAGRIMEVIFPSVVLSGDLPWSTVFSSGTCSIRHRPVRGGSEEGHKDDQRSTSSVKNG